MSLDLFHGGDLSHGLMIASKRSSISSIYFETLSYFTDEATGAIDYSTLSRTAAQLRPKLIVAGSALYPRLINYQKFREIADSVGAYLVADITTTAGLIAADCHLSPFHYCDIVTASAKVCPGRNRRCSF